jgi:hypothetical protein
VYAEFNNHVGMQTDETFPGDIDAAAFDNCTTAGHAAIARPDLLIF